MAAAPGLHRVSEDELRRLVRALHRGALPSPVTRAGLLLSRFAGTEGDLSALIGLERQQAISMVSAVLLERKEGPATRPQLPLSSGASGGSSAATGAELLWSGPPAVALLPDLSLRVRDLLASAERSVLWAGVPLHVDPSLLRTLQALSEGRNIALQLAVSGTAKEVGELWKATFGAGGGPRYQALDRSRPLPPPCLVVDERRALLFCGECGALLADSDTEVNVAVELSDAATVGALVTLIGQVLALHARAKGESS